MAIALANVLVLALAAAAAASSAAEALFLIADVDGDGQLSQSEFEAHLAATAVAPPAATCAWSSGAVSGVAAGDATCEPFGAGRPSGGAVDSGVTALSVSVTMGTAAAPPLHSVDTVTTVYRADEPAEASRFVAASIAIGLGDGDQVPSAGSAYAQARLALALQKLEEAAAAGATLALLPEEFAGSGGPLRSEAGDAPFPHDFITKALGAAARRHRMYVAFGARLPGSAADQVQFSDLGRLGYNTQVVLDRETGGVVATYRKQFPCCVGPSGAVGDDGYPGRAGTAVVDLAGIGRVALLTCYDANFPEAWHAAFAQRADLVLWPSAYGGGLALRAYAALYHFHVVPSGWGDIRDLTGAVASDLSQLGNGSKVFVATLDLDRTLVHKDFTGPALATLLAEHAGDVEELTVPGYCSTAGNCAQTGDVLAESNFRLLARTAAAAARGVSVRALFARYGVRSLRAYQIDARRAINRQRQSGLAPQGGGPQQSPQREEVLL